LMLVASFAFLHICCISLYSIILTYAKQVML